MVQLPSYFPLLPYVGYLYNVQTQFDLCMVLCVPLEGSYYLLVQWQIMCWVVAFHNTDKSLQQQQRLKVQSVKFQQTDSQTEKINYTKLVFFTSDFVL